MGLSWVEEGVNWTIKTYQKLFAHTGKYERLNEYSLSIHWSM